MVDSAAEDRLHECREVFAETLRDPHLSGKPIVVFANKQDLPTAKSAAEIAEGLGLTTLQNARHHIVPCTALRRSADEAPDTQVDTGMRWMLEQARAVVHAFIFIHTLSFTLVCCLNVGFNRPWCIYARTHAHVVHSLIVQSRSCISTVIQSYSCLSTVVQSHSCLSTVVQSHSCLSTVVQSHSRMYTTVCMYHNTVCACHTVCVYCVVWFTRPPDRPTDQWSDEREMEENDDTSEGRRQLGKREQTRVMRCERDDLGSRSGRIGTCSTRG